MYVFFKSKSSFCTRQRVHYFMRRQKRWLGWRRHALQLARRHKPYTRYGRFYTRVNQDGPEYSRNDPYALAPQGFPHLNELSHQKRWMKHPNPTPRADRKKGILRKRRKARVSSVRQATRKVLGREDHRSQKLKLCRRRRV
jgi:hypothetical protein